MFPFLEVLAHILSTGVDYELNMSCYKYQEAVEPCDYDRNEYELYLGMYYLELELKIRLEKMSRFSYKGKTDLFVNY